MYVFPKGPKIRVVFYVRFLHNTFSTFKDYNSNELLIEIIKRPLAYLYSMFSLCLCFLELHIQNFEFFESYTNVMYMLIAKSLIQ